MKKFPIQYKNKNEYIPFDMILEHDEQCKKNHCGQSAQRLAERHGTSYLEAYYIINDSGFKHPDTDKADRYEENARSIVHAKSYEWLMKNNKLN